MTFRVVIEGTAEREFAEAVAFYEGREPGLGIRFARDVHNAFRIISKDPGRFPPASRLTRKAKIPPPWPYAIYFAVKSSTHEAIITTVWHGSRNPAELQRRL